MTHKRIALAGIALVVASCSGKSITRSDDPAAGGTESGQSGASSTSGSSAVGTGGSTSSGNGGSASFEGCACAVDSYTAVCGVDGITYDVACGRHCIGVEIACDGECPCAGAGGSNSGSGGSSAGGSGAGGSSAGGSSGVDCGCQLGAYFPVCGMDGQTYDATCGIECVPEPVDCYGECPCTSCNSLSFRYQQALARAKSCDPFVDNVVCTQTVTNSLGCGCPTWVNPDNVEAVEALADLEKQWNAGGCGSVILCPAIPCVFFESASCELSGDWGRCTDQFGGLPL